VSTCQVICRCRKILTSFRDWQEHLRTRHPQLYHELKSDGTLAEDRAIFRESRERAGR